MSADPMSAPRQELRLDNGPNGSCALFSADDIHRYTLVRRVDPLESAPLLPQDPIYERRLLACGLNPSTADAFKNDPTITREVGFARRLGCGLLFKVNAYAWRGSDPLLMWRAERAGQNIVGSANDLVIEEQLEVLRRTGGIALACWGVHAQPDRVARLVEMAREVGVEWQCLGVNKHGSPKHPLYVRGDAILRPWVQA